MKRFEALDELAESDLLPYGVDDTVSQLSFPRQVFLAIYWSDLEIHQEGLAGYFSGQIAAAVPIIISALCAIGAPRTADILKRAIAAAFPNGLPDSAQKIQQQAEELGLDEPLMEKLDSLDREYFAHPDCLSDLLYGFVIQHPDEFDKIPAADS